MKINLVNTVNGFLPASEEDMERKRHFKLGETYSADIKQHRNYEFHQKYFAMINIAWQYTPEEEQKLFRSIEGFRKSIEMTAGYYDTIYSPRHNEFLQCPMSIAYDKMDQGEFEQLYERVRIVLDALMTRPNHMTQEQFEKHFLGF